MDLLSKNENKWIMAGVTLFILGISAGMLDYFIDSTRHSLIFISVITLLASIIILSKYNLPLLKLLAGVILTLALFSQAYLIESRVSAILGLTMFITSTAEYRKDILRNT